MNLPFPNDRNNSYNNRKIWKDYKIDTPTFELTPVEKPDMSPFLIHMTGKKEIISILKGDETSEKINQGILKVHSPTYTTDSYDQKMVCFTESPIFSLDFFRYRKFERWENDERYGIGFDKFAMISRNVRPVSYIQHDITKTIINIYKKIQKQEAIFENIENDNLKKQIMSVFEYLYKYNYPLLEKHRAQGFMWEREWRFSNDGDFEFSYEDIKIICCPREEKSEIIEILGDFKNEIEFVESWREYSLVTKFLRERDDIQVSQEGTGNLQIAQEINLIKEKIRKIKLEKSTLELFNQNLEGLIKEREKTEQAIDQANTELKILEDTLSELEPEESNQKLVKNKRYIPPATMVLNSKLIEEAGNEAMETCTNCNQLVSKNNLSFGVCSKCRNKLTQDFYSEIPDYDIDDSQELWATGD